MNAFAAIVLASLLSRLGYQMARSPVLPAFAADLGALPEFIGVIVAASTVIGVFFKLPRLPSSCAADWMRGSSDAGLAHLRPLTNVTVSGVMRGNLHCHRQHT